MGCVRLLGLIWGLVVLVDQDRRGEHHAMMLVTLRVSFGLLALLW